MLNEIRISGLGVICEANLEFDSGLTVLTGETGAGKTMVVTSLHLLSGSRADASRVRTGSERAVVEGRFSTDEMASDIQAEVASVMESSGAETDEDGTIIAARSVTRDGRSRAHLGGRSVPVGMLASFTDSLLTVHGQNDQLRLLKADQQRLALDRFAGEKVDVLLAKYRLIRTKWLAAQRELDERTKKGRELIQEAERLAFSLEEIDSVNPVAGEDITLNSDIRRLTELDSLRGAAVQAHLALVGGDVEDNGGALNLLGSARLLLENTDDEKLRFILPRLAETIAVVVDVASELSGYLSELPSDPSALDSMLTRQSALKNLTRKYASDIDGVINWAEQARVRLASVDVSAEAVAELRSAVLKHEAELAVVAKKLTAARVKAAKSLAADVSAELVGLAMGSARLEVIVSPRPAGEGDLAALNVDGELLHAGSAGTDDVELRLGAHAKAEALPIGRTASGGELSRVMLALEVVLAASNKGTTMVFDEVDAGIGGRAAVEIGRRLARLAKSHQVIVVTHLPQVAAFADRHLVVDKTDAADGVISSGVQTLNAEQRVVELARMLAGLDDTDVGRAHAEELLAVAQAER
ncbi:MAG: DNA repair protein RecN [Mycobacteriaceae bacterium]